MNNKISDKDKKDWEDFLSNEEKLPNKDFVISKKKTSRIKEIDLHGFNLEQANTKIEKIINDSYQNGTSKIIVVTGKGLHSSVENDPYVSKKFSILKYSVPEYIKNNLELMNKIIEIKDANIEDGGTGAFYIFLRKIIK